MLRRFRSILWQPTVCRTLSALAAIGTLTCLLGQTSNAFAQDDEPSLGVPPGERFNTARDLQRASEITQLRTEAEAFIKQSNYKEAEQRYRSLVALSKTDRYSQAKLAWCLEKQGRQNEALDEYRKLIFSDAWELATRGNTGREEPQTMMDFVILSLSAPSGKWSEAVDVYNRTLAIPNLPEGILPYPDRQFTYSAHRPALLKAMAHLVRAQVERDPTAALGDCEEAVKLAPNEPITHLYLGHYQYQRWSTDRREWNRWNVEAREELERAASMDRRRGVVYEAAQQLIKTNRYKHVVPPEQSPE